MEPAVADVAETHSVSLKIGEILVRAGKCETANLDRALKVQEAAGSKREKLKSEGVFLNDIISGQIKRYNENGESIN